MMQPDIHVQLSLAIPPCAQVSDNLHPAKSIRDMNIHCISLCLLCKLINGEGVHRMSSASG